MQEGGGGGGNPKIYNLDSSKFGDCSSVWTTKICTFVFDVCLNM